jgi:hypothetical protein
MWDVTGQQRMLTSPRHLILPLHLSGVRVAVHSICICLLNYDYVLRIVILAILCPWRTNGTYDCQSTVRERFLHYIFQETLDCVQGQNFKSKVKELCKMLEIQKTRTTPYHPIVNGSVEGFPTLST